MNFAVVPAAGRSSRLGRPKALLPFRASCVLDTLVAALERGGIERLVVVVAPGEDRLLAHCTAAGLPTAVNERVSDGMLSSLKCGLRHLGDGFTRKDTLTLCPVDFPTLRADTIAALLDSLGQSSARIVVPRFEGRRGHPLVLSATLAEDIYDLELNGGLRVLLDRHPYQTLDVADPGIGRDLDTWIDYQALGSPPQPGR